MKGKLIAGALLSLVLIVGLIVGLIGRSGSPSEVDRKVVEKTLPVPPEQVEKEAEKITRGHQETIKGEEEKIQKLEEAGTMNDLLKYLDNVHN